jgi:hypothetical protein
MTLYMVEYLLLWLSLRLRLQGYTIEELEAELHQPL